MELGRATDTINDARLLILQVGLQHGQVVFEPAKIIFDLPGGSPLLPQQSFPDQDLVFVLGHLISQSLGL